MDRQRRYGCFVTVAMALTAWAILISAAFIIHAFLQEEVNMMDILDALYRLFTAVSLLALFVLVIDVDRHIDEVEDRSEEMLGSMGSVVRDTAYCAKQMKKPENRWRL